MYNIHLSNIISFNNFVYFSECQHKNLDSIAKHIISPIKRSGQISQNFQLSMESKRINDVLILAIDISDCYNYNLQVCINSKQQRKQ